MEDINDNLPTESKRYYLSHSEYVFRDEYIEAFPKKLQNKFKQKDVFKLTQLVCASNMKEARRAIIKQLELDGHNLVLKCRIDNLIVGD
jgi:hypothetical protein